MGSDKSTFRPVLVRADLADEVEAFAARLEERDATDSARRHGPAGERDDA